MSRTDRRRHPSRVTITKKKRHRRSSTIDGIRDPTLSTLIITAGVRGGLIGIALIGGRTIGVPTVAGRRGGPSTVSLWPHASPGPDRAANAGIRMSLQRKLEVLRVAGAFFCRDSTGNRRGQSCSDGEQPALPSLDLAGIPAIQDMLGTNRQLGRI